MSAKYLIPQMRADLERYGLQPVEDEVPGLLRDAAKAVVSFDAQTPVVQGVILNLIYVVGVKGFSALHQFVRALDNGDEESAYLFLLNSAVARAGKTRAFTREMAKRIKTGEIAPEHNVKEIIKRG